MGDRAPRLQHLATGWWQRGKCRAGVGPRGAEVRAGMLHPTGEPMVELLAAAVGGRARRLRLAFRILGRTVEADMEMIVVAHPWLHLVQPAMVFARFPAKRFLDRRVDEYAR